jgi:hypothetical protein
MESTIMRSLIVSVTLQGCSSIRARAEDFAGFLRIADDHFSFGVASNGFIVSDADFVADRTRTISASPGVTSISAFALSLCELNRPRTND